MTAASVALVLVLVVALGIFYASITTEFAFNGDSMLQNVVEGIADSLNDAVGKLGH